MIFTLNFHEFLHTMYKYVLNSVVKISMMFAKYFEYYTIILRGGAFSWTRCIYVIPHHEVPALGRDETAHHLGGQTPKIPNLGARIGVFKPISRKILKLA